MTKIVYRTTYPNGKIYVGMDLTNSINYFGSASDDLIARDFSWDERQSFTVTREVIWSSEEASDAEVRRVERDFIIALRANDPAVGYNRSPRFLPGPSASTLG